MTIFHHDTKDGPVGDEMLPLWNQLHAELARQLPGQPELVRCVSALYRGVWHMVTAKDPFYQVDLARYFVPYGDDMGRSLPDLLTKIIMMVTVRSERQWAKGGFVKKV